MLFDELKEKLKYIEPTLETIIAFWKNASYEDDIKQLTEFSSQENFWQNPDQTAILKKLQNARHYGETYQSLIKEHQELNDLLTLFANDETELTQLKDTINHHCKAVERFKLALLLQDEQDNSNCFLNINSGAGGTESQDWSEILLRMYVRFCERERLIAHILDYQVGEGAGLKSATLFIKGKNAYGLLKGEQGIHRLVRISPFDANKRRHTSFASVSLTPEVPDVEITIDTKDLRIDTYRASGAGGQHVNKTESAVRITHLPSGIVVQCQNERSQIQNRETAMKMLMAKLVQKEKDAKEARLAAVEKKKIEWGSQIRSYVLHPYKMVKDHRTDLESPQPELVLDGDLMPFIESYLIYYFGTKK
ncbi:MAG: peptide chain release factor 2 [Candidatus Babeliaceae bacterium]